MNRKEKQQETAEAWTTLALFLTGMSVLLALLASCAIRAGWE